MMLVSLSQSVESVARSASIDCGLLIAHKLNKVSVVDCKGTENASDGNATVRVWGVLPELGRRHAEGAPLTCGRHCSPSGTCSDCHQAPACCTDESLIITKESEMSQ